MHRVLLTGATGFLGRSILEGLTERDLLVLCPGRHGTASISKGGSVPWNVKVDLEEGPDVLRALMKDFQPDAVIHSAAYYGGIGICKTEPFTLFSRNIRMAVNVLEACMASNSITRFLSVGSACGYPAHPHKVGMETDLSEKDWWSGPLHHSVEAYGFTKKVQEVGARCLEKERGVKNQIAILTNLYGPHDVFQERRSHVVSALIKKFSDAKQEADPEVRCWGSGNPVREFLFVVDAAEAIVSLLESDVRGLVNIGTGRGTSIRQLAEMIKDKIGYTGDIAWDTTQPDGTMRKVLNVSRAEETLGWKALWSLEEGLFETIRWYQAHKKEADARP